MLTAPSASTPSWSSHTVARVAQLSAQKRWVT